jgi:hypothetical protein
MRIQKWLTSAFTLSALGAFSMLGSAYMAPQADAQSLSHARPATSAVGLLDLSSSTQICLTSAPSECLTNHGAGNRITIDTTDVGDYHSVHVNGLEVQLEDSAGNCVREFADTTVGLASGGCDSTNTHETWTLAGSGDRTTFKNKASGDFMGTFGTSSGLDVFGGPPESGFFTGWTN